MKLLLALAVILFALAGLLWMIISFLADTFTLVRGLWRSRAGLNPLRPSGRWRLLGLGLLSLGIALAAEWFGIGISDRLLIWLGAMTPGVPLSMGARFLLLLIGFGVAYAGFRCLGFAKRYEVRTADQVLIDDPRPPVLYLRSFKDDARVARQTGVAGFTLSTEETELAQMVHGLGPLVAIGKPGEPIAWAGAARKYVGDEWKDSVRSLMREARLVILRAGATAGLSWEIAESVKCVRPERLIFLIPLRRRQYEGFRSKVKDFLPCRLPEYNGRRNPATTLRAILFFDGDWTAHMLPVQETTLQYMLLAFSDLLTGEISCYAKQSRLRRVLEKTLQPVLARHASPPPEKQAKVPGKRPSGSAKTGDPATRRVKRDAGGRFQAQR